MGTLGGHQRTGSPKPTGDRPLSKMADKVQRNIGKLKIDEIPPLYGCCTQYQKHYATDAEELELFSTLQEIENTCREAACIEP